MPKRRPTVSVITTHRGDPVRLTNLLSSLERQSWPAEDFEWVVVDDASPEGAPSWFEYYEGPLTLRPIALMENAGRAKARNLAFKKARGKILALIDGDMEAGPVWLEMLVRGVQRTGGVVLGCHDPHPSLPATTWVRYLHSRGAHKHAPGSRVPGKYYASGDSALPASLVKEHGGFDESFDGWGGEDLEFGVRLEQAGVEFYYEPRARIVHNHLRNWDDVEANYRRYGSEVVPRLLQMYPGMEQLLSLDRLRSPGPDAECPEKARYAILRAACRETVFNTLKTLVQTFPRVPWPDALFDFLIFYLYSRTFEAELGE